MSPAAGTTPRGARGEQQASEYVRGMFGRVAPRYDLLNHLLSLQIDRLWRARTVERVSGVLANPQSRVLDLCCGTGDLLLALAAKHPGIVFGSDFCAPMLDGAQQKIAQKRARAVLFEADALQLPVPDTSVDLVTMAFGFRNLTNYQHGLEELLRILRPGGTAAILEFSQPPNPAFASLYRWYSTKVLPRIGGWISGAPDAYTYLPESVEKFPGAEELAAQMRTAGFERVEFERMTFGAVALHLGVKA